jgi:hypothetical protein
MSAFSARDLEDCIQKLVTKFREKPNLFYSESDMQCCLYHLLYSHPVLQKDYITKDGVKTGILHNEYRTYGTYVTENRFLKRSEKGRRGHFDLVILDPVSVSQEKLWKSKVLFAIEMAFDNMDLPHLDNDLTKLTDSRNKVVNGYMLWFLSVAWPDSHIVEERGKKLLAHHPNITWVYEKKTGIV